MYELLVYYPNSETAAERYTYSSAARVVAEIPNLLAAHEGCARIDVRLGLARLFSVDCHGARIP